MSRKASALPGLAESIAGYEAWMRKQLGDELVAKDLKRKHERMREHPFLFLRATCWRWAEAAPSLCSELMDAPAVASVGDAHAGNFGLWRDAGARLVWGVNDYDEAAVLPWCLDLVRLAASIALAIPDPGPAETAAAMLDAYARALAAPRPFVLERDHLWLRDAFAANDAQREDFWTELQGAKAARTVPDRLRKALTATLPKGVEARIAARVAGAGSLGRPRFTAWTEHQGGPLAAEVKALLPSCWKGGREAGLAAKMAAGRFRSPDASLDYRARRVTRRLSPNGRKLTFEEIGPELRLQLIGAMAADLAAIHADGAGASRAIATDLKRRGPAWLAAAATRVAEWTAGEHASYRG
ncbi:DUF2252 domain-containing protein [Sphingomonas sp. LB-2]|uniref:DUF2252 domain-containing protein n=1 Tax=Sphingomonas caeni TaxID=2984949 RepID=UPI002230A0C3|nr:DUF2252 domain-containing protein [Sphingomonas caeni]MCW3849256.1 DUF2252 domain-containing protein [Sphingomonas caeni]